MKEKESALLRAKHVIIVSLKIILLKFASEKTEKSNDSDSDKDEISSIYLVAQV